jgi:hypothetical protein
VAAGLLGLPSTGAAAINLLEQASLACATDDAMSDLRSALLAVALVSSEQAIALVTSGAVKALDSRFEERISKARRRVHAGYLLAVSAS